MRMLATMLGLCLGVAGLTNLAIAAEPNADQGVYQFKQIKSPDNPAFGPTEIFIYSNQMGTWKLAKGNGGGTAKYTWSNQMQNDNLAYLGFGEIVDNTGVGIPAGQKQDVWMFKATDAMNPVPNKFIFFAFSVDKLPGIPGEKYGFYYSWKDPTIAGNSMKRILLPNGTSRQ